MDLNRLKGRIAETLVEGILRRAGYQTAPVGREGRVRRLLKVGHDQFLPDFLVWKTLDAGDSAWPPYRLVGLEVKYRRDIGEYLRRDFAAELRPAFAQWPELYAVLVTDCPEPGRSCFQAVSPRSAAGDAPPETTDLHDIAGLDVYRRDVREHESLVKLIFPLLGGSAALRALPRMPAAAVAVRARPQVRFAH